MQGGETLVLEIFRQENTLKMSVFYKQELASTLRHYSQCAVSFAEIDKFCFEINSILNSRRNKLPFRADALLSLSNTGHLLWSHLLTRAVRQRLKDSGPCDLILSIDEELIGIPWEFLYDGNNFLCLSFNLGRIVRTKNDLPIVQYRAPGDALKMLVLANPTNDLKCAYLEGLNIKNKLDQRRGSIQIDFKSTSIDKFYIRKNLCDYDIVHFAGHCDFDPDNPDNSGWLLSDGRFNAADIRALASAYSMPLLVFSNACNSAAGDERALHNLACAFLFSGVRHYLGSIRKVEDQPGLDFAEVFYAYLVSGKSAGESVRLARLKLAKAYGLVSLHWSNYLLYGDPSISLFRPIIKQRKDKKKEAVWVGLKRPFTYLLIASFVFIAGISSYLYLPSANPVTYVSFSRSKELSRQGKNEQVIHLCEDIILKDPLFLAAYPLLGETYDRLGNKETALKCYFDYARQSEKKHALKELASAYIKIGWHYYLYAEYPKAADFYHKAIALSRKIKARLVEAEAMRRLAVWHIDNNEYARALELLTKSSEINREKISDPAARYNLACDYFDLGLLFSDKEDISAAQDFYKKSRAMFEGLNLRSELSDYYFNLGEIYLFEKQYQSALDDYLKGLKIDQQQGNKFNLAGDYNMIGELYADMNNLQEAESFFKRSIVVSKEIGLKPELDAAIKGLQGLYGREGKIEPAEASPHPPQDK